MSTYKFNPVSIIRKKRDGSSLTPREINHVIEEYAKDAIPDYQMSAFLMAGFIRGFDKQESAALTEAMLYSGQVVDLKDIPGRKVDKHSTGGVGDKVSLILAPVVAAYGIPVPMICGRGLGHTGGTVDKLESIEGLRVQMTLKQYRTMVEKVGLVMAGQTDEIAPADKKLYALRDVTATIESIPLIASSIMSKKLAEGCDALVLDVKFGSGAFMKNLHDARKLAEVLVAVGEDFGKDSIAYLTDMNQPLGYKIGNWLEVEESLDALNGAGPDDLMEIVHILAGTMICLGGKAPSIKSGTEKCRDAVRKGTAYRKFLEMVSEQGGDPLWVENREGRMERSGETQFEFRSPGEGMLQTLNAYHVGIASMELGAGRRKKEEAVDPFAGIVLEKKAGDPVKKGETIARCYTKKVDVRESVLETLGRAVTVGGDRLQPENRVKYRIDTDGLHEVKS